MPDAFCPIAISDLKASPEQARRAWAVTQATTLIPLFQTSDPDRLSAVLRQWAKEIHDHVFPRLDASADGLGEPPTLLQVTALSDARHAATARATARAAQRENDRLAGKRPAKQPAKRQRNG